jgi:hypothetical protein
MLSSALLISLLSLSPLSDFLSGQPDAAFTNNPLSSCTGLHWDDEGVDKRLHDFLLLSRRLLVETE